MAEESTTRKGGPPRGRDPLIGQVLDEKYEIRALLGWGGMGAVYEAQHLVLGSSVAIKIMQSQGPEGDPVALARFYQEARTAGSLGHPNICAVYDFGLLPDQRPYLVMEHLVGETLRAYLEARGTLSPADAVEIVSQILAALGAAHARGFVHRDVKPDNVFLAQHEGGLRVVKLLDFGVAKALRELAESAPDGLTSTGTVVGTLTYMAPEQMHSDNREVDGRADLYSTGVVLFQLLTGQRPFTSASQQALVRDVLQRPPPDARTLRSEVENDLSRVISRALAKDPDDRYESANAMIDALLSTSAGSSAPRSSLAPHLPAPQVVSTTARRDEQFRHLVAAFGTFSAAFSAAQGDDEISKAESDALRAALKQLEECSRHMRETLGRAARESEDGGDDTVVD